MDRWQVAQAMNPVPIDIDRSRPGIPLPPPMAPQVMTQGQRMVQGPPPQAGPGPMQQMGDTLQRAILQRAMANRMANPGANPGVGVDLSFSPTAADIGYGGTPWQLPPR